MDPGDPAVAVEAAELIPPKLPLRPFLPLYRELDEDDDSSPHPFAGPALSRFSLPENNPVIVLERDLRLDDI